MNVSYIPIYFLHKKLLLKSISFGHTPTVPSIAYVLSPYRKLSTLAEMN